MTIPLPEPHHDTRRRLMEAALKVFAEKGFSGAGIREIAEQAKANSAMVQYHFGGKEGLYKEALRFAFEQKPCLVHELPPVPDPSDPSFRTAAIQRFRSYIRGFIHELLLCHGTGQYLPPDVERAAMLLWNREMQWPRPSMAAFILESIQPYAEELRRCIEYLRPDLDEEFRFRLGLSIHGQILFLHNHLELISLMRGNPYSGEDLDSLAEHFFQFSLRGLGVSEALPPQGA